MTPSMTRPLAAYSDRRCGSWSQTTEITKASTSSTWPSVRTFAALANVTATAQQAEPARLSTPTGRAARHCRPTATTERGDVTISCVPLTRVWKPSMTVSVRSAWSQVVPPSSDVEAPRIPAAASAKPSAARTPISAAGSPAERRASPIFWGAASHTTPTMQTSAATQPSGASGSPSATADTMATRITSDFA